MNTYQISANGTIFGDYAGTTVQAAKDDCARDAGYASEADMVKKLEQPSEFVATEATLIAWNGCDDYIESDTSVFTSREEFKPFAATEIPMSDVPKDEDGKLNFEGLFLTASGRVYK